MAGVLYVVATPIGNLEDITGRAAKVLRSVAMIAAEDTRRTRVLLEAIGAAGPLLIALHAHNEASVVARILAELDRGADVALVSDAGTPLLSDPGFELVRACWRVGVAVLPVPGASAISAALSVCPLPVGRFRFEGFLPARAGPRRERLRELAVSDVAVVLFEAPHRVAECLADCATLMPARELMIGREMTKRHEQYLCGVADTLLAQLRGAEQLRGEFVIVIPAAAADAGAGDARRIMEVLCRELAPAQAARLGAELLGIGKRELYALALSLRDEDPNGGRRA
jgi:16S rRNA (cytidine1402-2'-O)-methyltransferase